MVRKALQYGFGAIALYLGVYYASGAGTLINAGSSGATNLVKAFQGR